MLKAARVTFGTFTEHRRGIPFGQCIPAWSKE